MKKLVVPAVVCCLGVTLSLQNAIGQETPVYNIGEQGGHHRVFERTEFETGLNGEQIAKVRRYSELATGLNYLNSQGQWTASKEEIEILPNGAGATARQGQHKVIFAPNITDPEPIDLETPDGLRLRGQVLGLSYFDSVSGDAVLIAEIKSSEGQLVGENRVVYPDAFDQVSADIEYIYTKAGFEQNIVLQAQLPSPESLGLDPLTTHLQVLTEFIEPPAPSQGMAMRGGGELVEDVFDFGEMKMGQGKAFSVGNEAATEQIPVIKRWVNSEGRTFLVEEVQLTSASDHLNALPPRSGGALFNPGKKGKGKTVIAALQKVLPKPLAKKTPARKTQMARLSQYQPKGFVLDYNVTLSSATNFTFQSDTTYHVSGTVILAGTNTFEGGTIIKYAVSTSATIVASNTVWKTGQYLPAIFTSANDNSVGETVSGSSGNPTTSFAGNIALNLGAQSAPVIANAKFSYLSNAINGTSVTLQSAQLIQCFSVFSSAASDFKLRNVLGYKLGTLQKQTCGVCTPAVIRAENVTLHYVTNLVSAITNATITLTNSLLVQVTNLQPATITTNSSFILASDVGVFQTVNGGAHYLATNAYRNAGTTGINAALLADLKTRTTYPPIAYTNTSLSFYTPLSPQAQRDNDTPDLGYHYDPLDYIFGKIDLNTDASITAGTAIGWFRHDSGWTHAGHGLRIADTKTLTFNGLATSPCYYVHQTAVQEQLVGYTPIGDGPGGITGWATSKANQPFLKLNFTRFAGLPIYRNHIRDDNGAINVTANNCEFYGGGLGGYVSSVAFTNCLLDRVGTWLSSGDTNYNDAFTFRNCTLRGGYFQMDRQSGNLGRIKITILDNAFDDVDITTGDAHTNTVGLTTYNYNAFVTNQFGKYVRPWGANSFFTNSFNWRQSWLGNFYVNTNSPLVNAGSLASAANIGLYHFTITTNQVKDATSTLDIGYHYVTTGGSGLPLDYDGDGTPDYVEDANGNGSVDSGETSWTDANDLGLKVMITRPKGNSIVP